MNYFFKDYREQGVFVDIAFLDIKDKVIDFQVIMHIAEIMTTFDQQLLFLNDALERLLNDELCAGAVALSAQCFLSDPANQYDRVSSLVTEKLSCTICYVKQPPLDGRKVALWLQLQTAVDMENDGLVYFEHNGYRQYFTSDHCDKRISTNRDSYQQTSELLQNYENKLKVRGCTIERDCIRTWFFVRDVDINYQGVVEARKDNFELNGLTKNTHYIASTGIEGCVADSNVKVLMNALVIKGLDDGQINFLYAKDHLNSTIEYGVTFERGVYIDFGDRRKIYISGTASIDNNGVVMHPGNIEMQVYRMWENVAALLLEAECTFDDLMQIVVYLRDMADYQFVNGLIESKFPTVPKIIVLAPICRPGWLVEMECIASKILHNPRYRDL